MTRAEIPADPWPIGVFAGIDAGLGVHLDVASQLGIPTIQLHAPQAATRTPARAAEFVADLARRKIRLTAVFGGFAGESYADIPTVERTVGLVPESTRAERLREMKQISDFVRLLDCDVIALHLGFVPHDTAGRSYRGIVEVTQELCGHASLNGQFVHLETGQETAAGLIAFLEHANCPNLFVNFDPANMILYGTGEPVAALQLLGPRVRSVHCKDATWAASPGVEWGREVPFGEGQVDARKFLATLHAIGYRGPLTIEREIPQEPERQKAEIARAVEIIRRLSAEFHPAVEPHPSHPGPGTRG